MEDHHEILRHVVVRLRLVLLSVLVCLSVNDAGSIEPPVIAVLYPETPKPYRTVFAEIIEGIEQRAGTAHVRRYALPANYRPTELRQWLEAQSPSVIITLGRLATNAYDAVGIKVPQVIGALDTSPQTRPDATGISLSVDPPLLFATLKRLAPESQRVFVVFNPNRDQWVIDRAMKATAAHHLTLIALEATDLKTSARHFLTLLRQAHPTTDAIWLLMDSQLVDLNTLLPVIIEQSWQRRLRVFSNNLLHVDRGVLFALFPDNPALGQRLAELALRLAENPSESFGIEPLRDVKRALNLRVASHLDLPIDRKTERPFDLILQPR